MVSRSGIDTDMRARDGDGYVVLKLARTLSELREMNGRARSVVLFSTDLVPFIPQPTMSRGAGRLPIVACQRQQQPPPA